MRLNIADFIRCQKCFLISQSINFTKLLQGFIHQQEYMFYTLTKQVSQDVFILHYNEQTINLKRYKYISANHNFILPNVLCGVLQQIVIRFLTNGY